MTPREFVLRYLAENGSATVTQMAEVASTDDFGFAKSERFRHALARLEREGVVERPRRVPATDVHGRVRGGPRPWLWQFAGGGR